MVSIEEAIEQLIVFYPLQEKTKQTMAMKGSIHKLRRGEHLFLDKEEVQQVYILVEGSASIYKVSSQGDKRVIFTFREGQWLNETILQDLPASASCEILEPAIVLGIPKECLRRLICEDQELMKQMMESMALKIRRLYRQLKNSSNSINGEKKLAAKLYKLSKDYGIQEGKGIRINLNLSVTYLAEMVGSKRETVSRQLKKLVEEDLIIIEKNHYYVKNSEKIRQYFHNP